MKKVITTSTLSAALWFFTALVFATGMFVFGLIVGSGIQAIPVFLMSLLASLAGSLPAWLSLWLGLPVIHRASKKPRSKLGWLLLLNFFTCAGYGLLAAILDFGIVPSEYQFFNSFLSELVFVSVILFLCSLAALVIRLPAVINYFTGAGFNAESHSKAFQQIFLNINSTVMEQNAMPAFQPSSPPSSSPNRILIKGLITGGLILLMLIPTLFITELVKERQLLQKQVVEEVSSKWSNAQTLSGPFLAVPYTDTIGNVNGVISTQKKTLILLAAKSELTGTINPEVRPRSIYKVLLYKSDLKFNGLFRPLWPSDINPASLDFAHTKLCFSLSDFKGIEEELSIHFNGQPLMLTPGLPVNDFGNTGLSVQVNLSRENLEAGIPFAMQLKLKGSERLHFIPMAASSKYALSSVWPSPSFDGNSLPNERTVSGSGFTSSWSFNQANLPYASVIRSGDLKADGMAFGVSLVQPAGQYDKTLRSVKYAILFIGLTFALFFIIELMQKKPFHPVQYVLVGLALVIFYTLLLSISEYIVFDNAYLVAASATVLLISFYAKSHFRSWKTAGVFAAVLGMLYGFIFILIRLEDTALLVGSIGLFVVLALVMYASRKINWYAASPAPAVIPQS